MKVTIDNELINKAITLYETSPERIDKQAKSLGIGRPRYLSIIKDNYETVELNSREGAWELFKQYPKELGFYRKIGKSDKTFRVFLLSIVMGNDELKNLVEDKGVSAKKIAEMINMPFITEAFIHDRTNRLKFKYSKEAIKASRLEGLKETYKDKEKLEALNNKRRETLIDRYGADNPMRVDDIKLKQQATVMDRFGVPVSTMNKDVQKKQQITSLKNNGVPFPSQNKDIYEKVIKTNLERYGEKSFLLTQEGRKIAKQSMMKRYGGEYTLKSPVLLDRAMESKKYNPNNIEFTPTEFVDNAVLSKEITVSLDTLYAFLKSTFPDKKSFTLSEIAEITGRSYNFIGSRFSVDNNIITRAKEGVLPRKMHDYLTSLGFKEGYDFIVNDRKSISPLEIDFYFPKQKVGIEVNDIVTHNHTFNPFDGPVKSKNYHMEKSKLAKEKGIRLIHAWEHYFNNAQQYGVLQNAIKHALGISNNRVYARNTYVKEVPNVSLKSFFNDNNIQGFRGAKTAYALFDKKTDEVLMAYSVGASHFAHNNYDLELIRGASKLDTTIVGGASKLWKFIVDSNPDVNSIVYYIDRNIYNGSSIGSLEGHLELINTQPGFWNYFVETGEMKNRQPGKHKEIKELVSQGKVWEVYNAGTETYVWKR